ncbi:hypothetical protein FEM48_Zijuj09G0218200 [Ziziphus jujuba var. spinosa]|uniref:Uncharacterized protein n=1 Tax=Ziziphus jujuba var. spinosa TaxID=714518 RepID=A0A978UVI2_ZIZJJ|nr:hypothetical protein FEM48_Zijuj09G0218200 [Ziziphus jujuba var. spinosa]
MFDQINCDPVLTAPFLWKYSILSLVNSIDLSNNKLSGKIPFELPKLQKTTNFEFIDKSFDREDSKNHGSQHAARGKKEEKHGDAYETIGFFISMS